MSPLGLDISMTTLTPTGRAGLLHPGASRLAKKREAGDPRKSPASAQLVSPFEVGASEAREYMPHFRLLQVFLLTGKAPNVTDVRARPGWESITEKNPAKSRQSNTLTRFAIRDRFCRSSFAGSPALRESS